MKRRWMGSRSVLGAVLLLVLTVELWLHVVARSPEADPLTWYVRHVTQAQGAVNMRYAQLSAQMDETALRQHFKGITLVCQALPGTADTECTAEPQQVDNVAALRLRLRLSQGRLVETRVNVPWWSHHLAVRRLLRDLGAPQAISEKDAPNPTVRWAAPYGEVALNRAPGFDPLQSSTVLYTLR